jgi:hypothetical protein
MLGFRRSTVRSRLIRYLMHPGLNPLLVVII